MGWGTIAEDNCAGGDCFAEACGVLILSGQVAVNGKVVTEALGSKADPEKDKIEAAGRTIKGTDRRVVYMLMHKPAEVVSSLADPEGRKNLWNLLRGFPGAGLSGGQIWSMRPRAWCF